MNHKLLRILVIPGYKCVNELSYFLNKITHQFHRIKLFIVGEKWIVELVGKFLGREFLSRGNIILYRVDHRIENRFAEALRLFINVNPSIIIFFLRKISKEGFNPELLYPLALNKGSEVLSYVKDNSRYICVGKILYSIDDLISLIERFYTS